MRQFFPGDTVQYDSDAGLIVAVVVPCPDHSADKAWAIADGVTWVRDISHGTCEGWLNTSELTLVSRPLSILTNCDTMGTSTDDTKGNKMPFNRKQAEIILAMLGIKTVAEMSNEELEAYVALRQFSSVQYVDLMMNVTGGKFIEGIKMIRHVLGLGLKEAKDLYDSLDPQHLGGLVGPIKKGMTIEDAELFINNQNPSNLLDYSYVSLSYR